MDAQTKIIRASHMIDMNDIIREGNPTLRAVAEDVTFPLSDEDIILGEKMMQFLRNSQDPVIAEKMGLRGGVGLAAPQVGILRRICVIDVMDGDPIILINPEIIETAGEQTDEEGCLSIPGKCASVTRADYVKVKSFDMELNPVIIEGEGLRARALQHEIDHLDGVLYGERANEPYHDVEEEECE